jgi:CheY-like chemotaxis protein
MKSSVWPSAAGAVLDAIRHQDGDLARADSLLTRRGRERQLGRELQAMRAIGRREVRDFSMSGLWRHNQLPTYGVAAGAVGAGSEMSTDDLRILVVDDVEDTARSLAQVLELGGFVARTAHDGSSALAAIEEFRPHCVLLDIAMPGMDGNELVHRVRAAHGDDIVLVAITGGDALEARVASTFEQVDHYLPKPIDFARLMRILLNE